MINVNSTGQTPMTVRSIANIVHQLSPVEQFELMKFLLAEMETLVSSNPVHKTPLRSAYGICADLTPIPTEQDIETIRQEVFGNFPREDIRV